MSRNKPGSVRRCRGDLERFQLAPQDGHNVGGERCEEAELCPCYVGRRRDGTRGGVAW